MKRPQTPPPLFPTESGGPQLSFRELASIVPPSRDQSRYLHWDELRRRTPPKDIDHVTWWRMLKLRRLGLLSPLPLKDTEDRPFQVGLPNLVEEALHFIDTRLAGSVSASDDLTNEDQRNRYLASSLIEEAIRSSQLEGAVTTRDAAKEMIRTRRRPSDRSERMILNNYLAMERIRELRLTAMTVDLILEIQRIVTEDALDDPSAAGRFRRSDERVRVVDVANGTELHQPPAADELPERLQILCDFANSKTPTRFVHPVVRSIVLHFWLAYDHPFVDGNGRTARALFYWSMLHHGYWLSEFISISNVITKGPAKYARAFLFTETDDNDVTYFLIYHLNVIQRATDSLYDYLKRKASQLRSFDARLGARLDLNYRQRALLGRALRHPNSQFTIQSHRTSHRVVYQTARTDLLDLVEKGFLSKVEQGRRYAFVPVEDLDARLHSQATQ